MQIVGRKRFFIFLILCHAAKGSIVGAASQAGNADSSRTPGLTSGLQGSLNDQRGALLLVPN